MGTSGTKDCLGASNCVLNVSTDGAFTITPGNVFQYGTTQTVLTTPGFTPLLVNLESMVANPRSIIHAMMR